MMNERLAFFKLSVYLSVSEDRLCYLYTGCLGSQCFDSALEKGPRNFYQDQVTNTDLNAEIVLAQLFVAFFFFFLHIS